jgi:hypothetical protein
MHDDQWINCQCPPVRPYIYDQQYSADAIRGFCPQPSCYWQIYVYMTIMFVGLFFGNLFFMTTMMIVLR